MEGPASTDAFIEAAQRGHLEHVQEKLARGVSINAKHSSKNKTPLALAVQRGHSSIVNVLRGSQKYTADDFVEAARRGELGDIEAMISWGMAVDIQNKYGVSALAFAVDQSHVDIARYLLANGADPNGSTRYGASVWLTAIDKGNIDIVILFLRAGASANVTDPDDGSTPLHIAACRGYADIAALLIENGADKSAQNIDQDTPYRDGDFSAYLVGTWKRTLEWRNFGSTFSHVRTTNNVVVIEEDTSAAKQPNTRFLKWSFGRGLRKNELTYAYTIQFIPDEQGTFMEWSFEGVTCHGLFKPESSVAIFNFCLQDSMVTITYRILDANTMAVCIVDVDSDHTPTIQYGNMYASPSILFHVINRHLV
ncbi:unnamed protein product, partial [Aphanomyces euteiches]